MQVDLGYTDEIKGVATQGIEFKKWFVRTFLVSFSQDGITWLNYNEDGVGTKVPEKVELTSRVIVTVCLTSEE